jgi:Cu/Ag efflux protein CusF
MTRRRTLLVAAALALSIGLTGYASAQTSAPSPASGAVAGVAAATQLIIHGKIAAVDESKKLVTLEANGRKVTFTVENPYNLKAAKVGDPVVVHYYEVVSVRKKKPGETVPAVSLNEGIATAKSGTPGAVAGERTSVLVTVEEVDQANGTVTLKGPDGSVEKVKARDPKNLQHLKAGDELVVTVSRLTAIALDKESAG